MIEIRPVVSSKELMTFIKLPFKLYKDDRFWVAPLISEQKKFFNPDKNPYFRHSEVQLFVAYNGNRPIGRITAHTNTQHNKEHNDKTGFFGFFECEDNQEATNALVKTAAEWNKAKGMDILRGPMNFSVNDECGLLVKGFDSSPYILMTHHLPYYQNLLEKAGLQKAMDMYAYYGEFPELPEKIARAAALVKKRQKFSIRSLSRDKKQLREDIRTVFAVYTKAWEHNWGAVPLTDAEFEQMAAHLLPLADPDLIFIAEVDGKPAGFSLTMPNYNEVLKVMKGHINPFSLCKALLAKRKISTARVMTLGVVKEFQNRGIDVLCYYYMFNNCHKKGIWKGEFSWVLENNTMMNRIAGMLGATPYKTYRIYDLQIG